MHSHTASLSTISSIVIILFITCLSLSACSATSQKLQQQQHHHDHDQQQQQPQSQHQQPTPTTVSNQNSELLRQLLTLTANSQQQQQSYLAQGTNELKFDSGDNGLAGKLKKQAAFEAKLAAESVKQKKLAIKRKLHKLVDEIIDESVAADEALREEVAAATRRRAVNAVQQNQQVQEQQQQKDDGDDGLMMMIKRKPLTDNNELGDLFSQPSSQSQQPPRRPANLNEHARNILDDSFGIRRDSVFTTNNHLGLKGVPKFGSDEQF